MCCPTSQAGCRLAPTFCGEAPGELHRWPRRRHRRRLYWGTPTPGWGSPCPQEAVERQTPIKARTRWPTAVAKVLTRGRWSLTSGLQTRLTCGHGGDAVTTPLSAGWYPAPNSGSQRLYWDGLQWHAAPPPPPALARKKKRKTWPWILGILLVLFVIGQCDSSAGERRSSRVANGSGSSPSVTPSPTTTYDGSAYAASILTAVLEGFFFKSTNDACAAGVGWVCAIDRIDSPSEGRIKVILKPEQEWISMADTTDWYKWGEEVARNIYHFVDATGISTSTCYQKTIHPPDQIDVYESNGHVAFLSPPGFPLQRQRNPHPC